MVLAARSQVGSRSLAGLLPIAVGLALCLFAASPLSAEQYASRLKLQTMLRQGDFDALEQTLAGLERSYKTGRISDDVVDHAYYAFSSADAGFADQLAKWIAAKPRSHRPLIARGLFHSNLGWIYRGAATFSQTSRQRIAAMQNQFRSAQQDLRAALQLKPDSGVAYSYLIEMEIAGGSPADRDALLRAGLRADPASLAIRRRYFFGLTPWWGGGAPWETDARYPVQLPRALRLFARDVERDAARIPRLKPLLGYLDDTVGEILQRNGQYAQAAAFYKRALTVADYWQFHADAAENYLRMGRFDDAIGGYTRALELRPDVQDYLRRRGVAYLSKGDVARGLEDLDAASKLAPNDPELLLLKAKTLLKIGRVKEALAALDAAVVYGKFDDEIWITRGGVYLYRLSDARRALPDIARARQIAPSRATYVMHYLYALVASWVQ